MVTRIIAADLKDRRVVEPLGVHLRSVRAQTAPGSAHALDVAGLDRADVQVWTIWDGDRLLGVGALKALSSVDGEVKSMHTAEAARGRGMGSAMLRHMIGCAGAEGLARLSLETGSWDYFAPARALYRRHGFQDCGPFGDYRPDPNSVFMTLDLQASRGEPQRS